MTLKSALKQVTPKPIQDLRERQVTARIDRDLANALFDSPEQLAALQAELDASGLLDHIEATRREFAAEIAGATTRGNPYGFGAITNDARRRLFAVIRQRGPSVGVETGVCNGVSTAITLKALDMNGRGELHSIDYPEVAGSEQAEHWEGKLGAVIPPGKTSGWVIPDELRPRWTLHLGRSQDLLPPLLERLGTIDYYFHDGEHSYDAMMFEFELAWPRLAEGGLLAADDTEDNTSFQDFAAKVGREVHLLGGGVRLLVR